MERKQFKQAPLPFTGQKRMFLTHFEKILNEHIPDEDKGWTIIDVFGESGLLAHTAKHIKPQATVVYNDFDGYTERLKHINDTNRLRIELFNIVSNIIPKQALMGLRLFTNLFKPYCHNIKIKKRYYSFLIHLTSARDKRAINRQITLI